MSYCGECGGQINERAVFCGSCGHPVPSAHDKVSVPTEGAIPATPWPAASAAETTPDIGPTYQVERRPTAATWLRRRRARIVGRICLTLALLGAGVLVGWALGADQSLVEVEPDRPDTSAEASPAALDEISMPDLRGLATADARQVLADLGVAAATVTVRDQPAAGESGIVLSQDPVFGYAVDGAVSLAVSTPARVPAYRGRSATVVLDELDQLGAEVETVTRYAPGVPVGHVAEISPPPGTLLPVAVTVVIAAEPESLDLADVESQDGTCYTEQDTMNGVPYNNLLTCGVYRPGAKETWVVAKAASRLTGLIGIPDSGDSADQMQVQVVLDGVPLLPVVASYGTTVPLDVDLTDVLQLTIRFRPLSGDYVTVGMGRLKLLGDARLLKKLELY